MVGCSPFSHLGQVTPGESLSDVFPSWIRLSYDGFVYRPYDMNMPRSIPRRPPSEIAVDPPLTEHGAVVSQLTGKVIRLAGIQPIAVISAPEHRCVQTAAAIVKALDSLCYIYVENGLQSWTQMTCSPLNALFPRDLSQLGLPIFEGYQPLLHHKEIPPSESLTAFCDRILFVNKHLVQKLEGLVLFLCLIYFHF